MFPLVLFLAYIQVILFAQNQFHNDVFSLRVQLFQFRAGDSGVSINSAPASLHFSPAPGDIAWYGMFWYGLLWYGSVWFGLL